ncbi:MAG: hypothetical protein H7Z41_18315, partial [Cytophagales bacterium]|nr:hypothetical protein [Armatimonadota bacterium]
MLRFFVPSPPAAKTAVALGLLAAVVVLLFWPLIFGQKALFFGDISLYFTPLLQFQRGELLSHGRIPLWNPTI